MTNYELIKKCETIEDLGIVLNKLYQCPSCNDEFCGIIDNCELCNIAYLNRKVFNIELENLVLQ